MGKVFYRFKFSWRQKEFINRITDTKYRINEHILLDPNEYIVLGSSSIFEENGNINIDYQYDNFNLSNVWDEIIISHATGILDEVVYSTQTFPNIEGRSMMLLDPV